MKVPIIKTRRDITRMYFANKKKNIPMIYIKPDGEYGNFNYDFVNIDFDLKDEVADKIHEIFRKWIIDFWAKHKTCEIDYSVGGHTCGNCPVHLKNKDKLMKFVLPILLNKENWMSLKEKASSNTDGYWSNNRTE